MEELPDTIFERLLANRPDGGSADNRDLMPDELFVLFPDRKSQAGKRFDAVVYARYIDVARGWVYFATGFDGVDEFDGFVIGDAAEFDPFTLSELEALHTVRRAPYFIPKPLIDAMGELRMSKVF